MNDAETAAKLGLPLRTKREVAIRELLELRGAAGACERAGTEPMSIKPADLIQLCDFVLEALEPITRGCPCGVEHSAEDSVLTFAKSQAVTIRHNADPNATQGVAGMSICRNCGSLYVIALVDRRKPHDTKR